MRNEISPFSSTCTQFNGSIFYTVATTLSIAYIHPSFLLPPFLSSPTLEARIPNKPKRAERNRIYTESLAFIAIMNLNNPQRMLIKRNTTSTHFVYPSHQSYNQIVLCCRLTAWCAENCHRRWALIWLSMASFLTINAFTCSRTAWSGRLSGLPSSRVLV